MKIEDVDVEEGTKTVHIQVAAARWRRIVDAVAVALILAIAGFLLATRSEIITLQAQVESLIEEQRRFRDFQEEGPRFTRKNAADGFAEIREALEELRQIHYAHVGKGEHSVQAERNLNLDRVLERILDKLDKLDEQIQAIALQTTALRRAPPHEGG